MLKKLRSLVQVNWKTGLFGAVLAGLYLFFFFEDMPKKSIVFAAAFLVIGFCRLNTANRWVIGLLNALWTAACMAVACIMPFVGIERVVWSAAHNWALFKDMHVSGILLNMMLMLILCVLVFLISRRWKLSVTIVISAMILLAIANGFVYQFRGKELMLVDFLSIGTALNVAGQYMPRIYQVSVAWYIFSVAALLCQTCFPDIRLPAGKRPRLMLAAGELALMAAFFVMTKDMNAKSWGTYGLEFNGYHLNFYLGARDSLVLVPEGYSADLQLDDLPQEAPQTIRQEQPDVVVIMNEAFADLSVLGSQMKTNVPVTPYVDSLTENTVRGYALASVFGGNTANSEFEFLTGHSMAFLPNGTVPYQFYIREKLYNLTYLMESMGYSSFATHPYKANGWSRPRIYPLLGFDAYTFEEDYPHDELIRDYVSDKEMYRYLLEKLDSAEKPLFLFGITMQNHGSYIYEGEDFTHTVSLEGYSHDYTEVEQYLTVLQHSDSAVEMLLEELKQRDRKTVVVFFGDHLPAPGNYNQFFNELHEGGFETLDEKMLQYQVPFFIWANYDIPEQTVECTSLNYLSRYLLEVLEVELPPYYTFLKEMESVVPAMNSLGYYSVSQGRFLEYDQAAGTEAQWLDRYECIQYNNMFDGENRNELLFAQYMSDE